MKPFTLENFVRESNRIEGIERDPTADEIEYTRVFLAQPKIQVGDMVMLVKVYQPDAVLRDKKGLDVRVGNHLPIRGGPDVPAVLKVILEFAMPGHYTHPYYTHHQYETLHPFTDGNGRSGRALWLWGMRRLTFRNVAPLGFLHTFYYQSLEFGRP